MMRKKSRAAAVPPPHPSERVGNDVVSAFPKMGTTLSSNNPLLPSQHGDTAQRPGSPAAATLKKATRHRRVKKGLKWMIITLVILALAAGGYDGWKFVRNEQKLFGGSIFDIFHSTTLKGEDQGRVNILLAGNSADDPGHNGANLTDSIMIISIDTNNNTAFLLSVPRDMWVNIPGFGYSKINAAYEDGVSENFNQPDYTPGGMGLLEEVVNQDFGMTMDYSALVNYSAFKDAVNAVGGITVNIQSCSLKGLYDPDQDYATGGILVNLRNGEDTLDGEQALDLARARGEAYGSYGFCQSDFTREQDQRQMMIAIKSKATSLSVLSNPIKVGELFDSLGNNVQTDLTASDARTLYNFGKKISNSNITSASLNSANGKDLLQSYEADGEDSLIPAAGLHNYSAIQAYIQQLETPATTSTTTTTSNH
jgi:LCP family protein required for cell wall assembly